MTSGHHSPKASSIYGRPWPAAFEPSQGQQRLQLPMASSMASFAWLGACQANRLCVVPCQQQSRLPCLAVYVTPSEGSSCA